jgi:hypothetical protein
VPKPLSQAEVDNKQKAIRGPLDDLITEVGNLFTSRVMDPVEQLKLSALRQVQDSVGI